MGSVHQLMNLAELFPCLPWVVVILGVTGHQGVTVVKMRTKIQEAWFTSVGLVSSEGPDK